MGFLQLSESRDGAMIVVARVLTFSSWSASVVVSLYYTIRLQTWSLVDKNPSMFTMDAPIVSVFWVGLFLAQLCYTLWIFLEKTELVTLGVALTKHFFWNNVLHLTFTILFSKSQFIAAEVVLLSNFANLTWAYFLFNSYPRFIHFPVVSGPLAWTYIAIYCNGAFFVPHNNLAGQIIGSLCIWGILVYGLLLLINFKDFTIGVTLGILSAAICVAQFQFDVFATRWIFPLIISVILLGAAITMVLIDIMRVGEKNVTERLPVNVGSIATSEEKLGE